MLIRQLRDGQRRGAFLQTVQVIQVPVMPVLNAIHGQPQQKAREGAQARMVGLEVHLTVLDTDGDPGV
jgi:hypothetical protein